MNNKAFIICILLASCCSCNHQKAKGPELAMTSDEIVQTMIQLYIANAALGINDIKYRDSTASIYYHQVEEITGKSITTIKSDFEKLQLMQDSLIAYQSRALDSLRVMQERGFLKPRPL